MGQTGQIASRQLASSNLATTWSYLTNANDRRLASVGTTGLTAGQSSTFSYVTNPENQTTGQTQASEAAIAYPPGSLLQTASYNTLNQLTNLNGQAQTFDADGNLLSDGTRTYSWDAENRLVAIAYPGQPGKATSFAYDGLGRRVQWSSTPAGGGSATVTSYLWCGQVLCQARNVSNAPVRGYYCEGEFVPGSPSTSDYYAPDRVGSVRRVFSNSAAPTYDYDPYGGALQATAPLTDYGYAGMVQNPDSGLWLTTHRPYDPVTGRFLLRDPIGEAGDPLGNLYAYVGGDPVGSRDPSGLDAVVLLNSGAVGGFGHVGILVGNDEGGWQYMSKNGYGQGNYSNESFNTLDQALSSPNLAQYNHAETIYTSPAQDAAMKTAGAKLVNKPYNFFSANCADFIQQILDAGGVNATPSGYFGITPSVPTNLFNEPLTARHK